VTVPVIPRLAIQFVLVGAAVATLPTEYRIVDTLPWWLERALWVVAGVWFVNLVNFMDGLDWMTVAEVVPVTGGLVILGYASGMPSEAIVMAAAMCGAVAGFAPFNRPVAKLFLGDVGSLPIGLLLAWLLALLASRGHLTAAILLPLYYLIDATSTLILRIRRGERVWEGHRSHFYQRATDGGFAVWDVVSMVFVLNLLLGGLAATTVWANSRAMDYIALGTGCVLVCCLLALFARGKRLPR
jgi:UDP-N-acetylmuramyl pentapeptide phosphotransferase/UDP-N-acetylglucosamine-1-phosphate transferase